jgi:hypothetical protein
LRTLIVGNRRAVFVGQNGLIGHFSLFNGRFYISLELF